MKQRIGMMVWASSPLLLALVVLAGDWTAGAQAVPEIKRTSLLKQDATIPGYDLIMNIVEIPAGVSEIRHTHPGPLAGYILEGTLILEHEGKPTATYKPGEAFLVEAGKIHQGINQGATAVKILATVTVEKGKPPTSPAP
jgi:quercetin dioxygenase-like cupin family protein